MKVVNTIFFSICINLVASAQVEIRDVLFNNELGNDVSGTTVNTDVSITGSETIYLNQIVAIKNISGSNQYLRIKRLRINAPNDWTDHLCFSPQPDPNFEANCYGVEVMLTNPWTTPNVSGTNHGYTFADQGLGTLSIYIDINSPGTGLYRYYVMPNEGDVPIDSVDFQVNASVLSLADEKYNPGMITYPNPADNFLMIEQSVMDDSALKISDILGNTVYFSNNLPVEKINVSDFKEGVYFVSLYKGGFPIQVNRVLIRH